MSARSPWHSILKRSIATMVAIGVAVVLVLLLLSGVVNREIAWTASRSPGRLALPVRVHFADTAAVFAAVDAYVTSEMKAVRAPGLSLAIVHGDQIVHRSSFGIADPQRHPVTSETPFILGSLSKSFTALAIMQQVDQGRVVLDAPVQRYLTWFAVRDRVASTRITVRHLLNHTSGLPKSAGLQLIRSAEAATRTDEARLVTGVRLHNAPGAAFEYSNANYWLLGLVLEAVTGTSYETYVQAHVFSPLGMAHTYTDEGKAERHGLAQGYQVWFGFPRAEELPYYWREMAVGYLISDANDMARYLLAHMNGGSDGGPVVISAQGLAELHTPPAGSPYAMGWLTDSVAGTAVLWHAGAVANYHGDMLIVPSARWGVVLLSNVNNFVLEGQLSAAAKGVASLLLGFEPPQPRWMRFRSIYALIAALGVLWLAWRIKQVATLVRWRKLPASRLAGPVWWRPAGALVDPGVALGLFVGVPLLLGSPLSTLRWFVPDLTDWLILNTVVALVIAGARMTQRGAT